MYRLNPLPRCRSRRVIAWVRSITIKGWTILSFWHKFKTIAYKYSKLVHIINNWPLKWCLCQMSWAPLLVMSKSVRPKPSDLSQWQISFGLTKINISAAYFIVQTDKVFQISPNCRHYVKKDFNISVSPESVPVPIHTHSFTLESAWDSCHVVSPIIHQCRVQYTVIE